MFSFFQEVLLDEICRTIDNSDPTGQVYAVDSTDTALTKDLKKDVSLIIWAVSRQNQHNGFATSMDPDQPAHPRSLIRIHAVRYQFLYLLQGL
jgi:hypothetical protein